MHSQLLKCISIAVSLIAGYLSVYLFSKKSNNEKFIFKLYLWLLLVAYLVILVDYTLIDQTYGRNIFNILNWNKSALETYLKTSTNLIPFETVKLFINAFVNKKLSIFPIIVNLVGNLIVLAPLPFFAVVLFNKVNTKFKIFAISLSCSITVELLQFIFLTGCCDVDDVILNVLGAMIFYLIFNTKRVRKFLIKFLKGEQ